jgi:hypothetical protein
LHLVARMRLRQVLPSLVAAATLVLAAPFYPLAGAAEPDPAVAPAAYLPAPAAQGETVREWYGYQNLGVDGAALALVFGGEALDDGTMFGAGLLGYALGSPIVHGHRGNGARAFGSAALRVGLPLLGGAIGIAADSDCRDSELCIAGVGVPLLGILAGMGSAILIDDLLLARDLRPASRRVLAPTLAPTAGGGMSFGLAGTF